MTDTLSTNQIVSYVISGNSTFIDNERVTIALAYKDVSNNHVYSNTGHAQVVSSNSSTLIVQHTSGIVVSAPSGYTIDLTVSNNYVVGANSGSNCTIIGIKALANNIVASEAIYWSPVTIYEDEVEKNLKNKTIRLMDPAFVQGVSDQMTNLLANTAG